MAGYSLDNGIIRYKNKLWIAQNSALQTKIIAAFHSSAIGGHSGTKATYQRLKTHFAWKGMKMDVEDFVKQCSGCQQAKHSNHPHLDYCSLYQFLKGCGWTYLWIS